ncbi:hypothetical protein LSAT2_009512 [Lamellibrachia satsuma]|nr:hypothetical protein LSAT2_009512 [Lamellibrachia satsuma]
MISVNARSTDNVTLPVIPKPGLRPTRTESAQARSGGEVSDAANAQLYQSGISKGITVSNETTEQWTRTQFVIGQLFRLPLELDMRNTPKMLWMNKKKKQEMLVFLPALGLLVVSLTVPAPINPVVISLPEPPKMEGVLEVNDLLTTGERLFEDEIMGPESIVFHKGHMYTGTADGKIVDIKDGKMSILTTLGTPPCGSSENEPTCGHPLGLRMHNGSLFVIDTYLGLFKIFVDTERFDRFENEAKSVAPGLGYDDENKRAKKRELFHDETPEEVKVSDCPDTFRVNTYLVIIDILLSEVKKRKAAYTNVYERFGVLTEIRSLADSDITSKCEELTRYYDNDIEPDFEK